MAQPVIYILQSLKNDRYYIGSSNNLKRRLQEHLAGKVSSTKYLRPLQLKFFSPCQTLREARALEYKLKHFKNRKIIEQIITDGQIYLQQ